MFLRHPIANDTTRRSLAYCLLRVRSVLILASVYAWLPPYNTHNLTHRYTHASNVF